MEDAGATQSTLMCPSCAGQRRFEPTKTALLCQSFGDIEPVEHPDTDDAAEEFPYSPAAQEAPVAMDGASHVCQTCGGEVVFSGAAISDTCPYCDGTVVLSPGSDSYAAMALMPFAVPKDTSAEAVLAWVKGRVAAPNDLENIARSGRMAGLYAPFWTFDTHEAIEYWATYTTGSGKQRRTHRTGGKMSITFDDVLVPASGHVTPLIRDGILHAFNPTDLRPFDAAYLAGFAAERHHQTVAQGLAANAADKDLLIRNHIVRHVNRNNTRVTRYNTDTSGIHYRRLLLPVWILHYRYGGRPKRIVVSGLDGRTYGERPFSDWKLARIAAIAGAGLIVFGWLWGAAGIL